MQLRCATPSLKSKGRIKPALQVPPELGGQYSEVLSSQDVALYGALCAMASFDRAELRAGVIDSPGFREFLELVPEVGGGICGRKCGSNLSAGIFTMQVSGRQEWQHWEWWAPAWPPHDVQYASWN